MHKENSSGACSEPIESATGVVFCLVSGVVFCLVSDVVFCLGFGVVFVWCSRHVFAYECAVFALYVQAMVCTCSPYVAAISSAVSSEQSPMLMLICRDRIPLV
jgi:hypothetical protein